MTLPIIRVERPSIDLTGLPARFMNPGELETLVALIGSVKPKGVLEFGVNTGRTSKVLMDNIPSIERYQGIDVPIGYTTSKEVQRREVPVNPGSMVETYPQFELILRPRGSLDLSVADLALCNAAFIDGDHGYDAVLHDTMLATALVRPGGIIVWHDYHDLGTVDVKRALDELYDAGEKLTRVEGTWFVYQRV